MLANDARIEGGLEGLGQGYRIWHLPENHEPTAGGNAISHEGTPLPSQREQTDTPCSFPTPLLGSRRTSQTGRLVSPASSSLSFPSPRLARLQREVTSAASSFSKR